MYTLLAAGLTVVMIGFVGVPDAPVLVAFFFVNLLISFAIGTSLWVIYAVVLPRLGIDADRGSGVVRMLVHGVAIAAAIFGGVFAALGVVGVVHPDLLSHFPHDAVVRVAIPVTIAIVAVGEAVNRWRRRAAEAERERLKSELAAIHARINPHFLFNSLNTIAALVHEDADRAEAAVLELSSLFRHTLEGSKQLWVPLSAEVEAARSYLAFEQLRFGDRLRTTFEVEGEDDVNVPPLVLQPLVENAVKHGIRRRDGGQVCVRVRSTDAAIALEVEDDGDGDSGEEGTATGEADLRRRLELVYEGRAGFEVGDGELGGYRVRLTLPRTPP